VEVLPGEDPTEVGVLVDQQLDGSDDLFHVDIAATILRIAEHASHHLVWREAILDGSVVVGRGGEGAEPTVELGVEPGYLRPFGAIPLK